MNKTLVIIPHYDKLELIKECIKYLEEQNTNRFDCLIVDNGSSDGSVEYLYDWKNQNERNHIILLNENMGFAYAVNLGLKFSIENGYEYSILLNNDAFPEKDFVKSLVSSMEEKYKYFALSALMINYKYKNKIDSFGDSYNLLGFSHQNKLLQSVDEIEKDEDCFSACGGACIYNNEILKKIGLLDNNFFAYLEDIDLSYRARLYGYKIGTCKNAKCYHLGSATSGSKYNEFKVRISARNNIYLIYKNMPLLQILLNINFLFLGFILKQIYFIKIGFGLDYFFGIVDGFRGIKNLEKVDFKKINIINIMYIEIYLALNLIKYTENFLNRKLKL